MQRRPTPGELWRSAPWYERLGMTLYLGGTVYAFVNAVVELLFR